MTETRPLVLTLALETPAQRRFEQERAAHFPAGRSAVGAHVTLFHALPARLRPEVEEELAGLVDLAAPQVEVLAVRSRGRGVAYDLACSTVEQLREGWRRQWRGQLTRQDDHRARLHVTVQNKVEPDVARRTLARLERGFAPWTTRAVGCRLWRYDGGPWTHLRDASFGR